MLFYTALLYLFTIKACFSSTSWTRGSSYYPEETMGIAVGYDNITDTILLFDDQRFVKFKDHQFTVVGEAYLPYVHRILHNDVHYYMQLGDVLWMIHRGEAQFVTINTHTYESSIASISDSFKFQHGACLSSSPGFIIIVGGKSVASYIDGEVQFYDITNAVWLDGPQLTAVRRYAGCAVVSNALYVIGGQIPSTQLATDSIEMMDISSLPSTTALAWSTLSATLSHARGNSVVEVHETDIYVAGGYAWITDSYDTMDYVDIIDTLTNTCVPSESMAFVQENAGSIIVDNVLFAFGGSTRLYQLMAFGPTQAPTSKPTLSPTPAPTSSPTIPPTSETLNPSISPTAYPTFMPSVSPSNAPSYPPTNNPTMAPSASPTKAPSDNPTTNPTNNPTTNPTNNPTTNPTDNPTKAPTHDPTKDSTDNPTKRAVAESIDQSIDDDAGDLTPMQYEQLDTLATTHQWVFSGFITGIIAISLFAWIDANCIPSRKNDYLQIAFIFGISLQTMDMVSDCFFAYNMGIWRTIDPMYTYLLISSVTFIVFPCTFTIVQLILHSREHWIKSSDQVRGWLASRSNVLYFASIITGSSFSAVSLCNSYLFQLDVFDMGLTRNEIHAFMYKRVYSVVIFENVPQLGLQCFFVYSLGALDDLITISSIIFSVLSIIVSILSMATQRSISRGQGTVSISMNVTGSAVTTKASNCKKVKRKLIKELSSLVGVSQSITELVKPLHIKQGFQVTVKFNVADSEQDFHRTLIEAQASGELANIFKRAWNLSGDPIVSDVRQSVIQSKRERLDSESLSEEKGKHTMTRNKTDADNSVNNAVAANSTPNKVNSPWNCSVCTYSNNPSLNSCQMCNNPKN